MARATRSVPHFEAGTSVMPSTATFLLPGRVMLRTSLPATRFHEHGVPTDKSILRATEERKATLNP